MFAGRYSYQPWHDRKTHRNHVRPTSGKCLHYYFYFMNAELGLVYLRVPTPGSSPYAIHTSHNYHIYQYISG